MRVIIDEYRGGRITRFAVIGFQEYASVVATARPRHGVEPRHARRHVVGEHRQIARRACCTCACERIGIARQRCRLCRIHDDRLAACRRHAVCTFVEVVPRHGPCLKAEYADGNRGCRDQKPVFPMLHDELLLCVALDVETPSKLMFAIIPHFSPLVYKKRNKIFMWRVYTLRKILRR